jgi:hypothetical protein
MVVIDSHELVILLLGYLVADAFTVDDGCHPIEAIALGILLQFSLFVPDWLYPDVVNTDFTAVSPFTEPSLVLVYLIE